ncbi:hypothetical protein N7508_000591 [Penicillium antarcticum]|uniref:uncharacterized protein n=1 Tax=Penicillium antarcticum TaxID=416450 RepID=UPI0023932267|nr:uncharacterized protein N7508_000591 [Penicillium antarcticum]KAJ5320308.1 hypothetical protein N7508_000591 [Penicillium antarcticum]
MGALTTTDYAAVSDGTNIYLYYQTDTNQIHEVTSADGSSWTASQAAVAENLSPGGSPITAYYVANDGTSGKKSAIHVIYLDASGTLHEKVKSPLTNTSWESRELPVEIKKAPVSTSRLSSGVCHDTAAGAHQWVFFEKTDGTTGKSEIAEIRSGLESQFKWIYRKVLQEEAVAALPGTQLATNLTNPTTHLFFQDHDGNITEYLGGYDAWNTKKVILTKEKVESSTPLTAAESSVADKPYVFFATKTTPFKIMVYNDGSSSEIAAYVPGTKLGAITVGGKVLLFHKPLAHPTSVWTQVYDGSAWKLGSKVVG